MATAWSLSLVPRLWMSRATNPLLHMPFYCRCSPIQKLLFCNPKFNAFTSETLYSTCHVSLQSISHPQNPLLQYPFKICLTIFVSVIMRSLIITARWVILEIEGTASFCRRIAANMMVVHGKSEVTKYDGCAWQVRSYQIWWLCTASQKLPNMMVVHGKSEVTKYDGCAWQVRSYQIWWLCTASQKLPNMMVVHGKSEVTKNYLCS
jgi:hypothetical protein